jgi:hypothetical protein
MPDCCEEGGFKSCGTMGFAPLYRWKGCVLSFMGVLLALQFILVCIAYSGSTENVDALKGTPWTIMLNTNTDDNTHDTIVAYYGLRAVFIPNQLAITDDDGKEYYWNSCSSADDDYLPACHSCYLAGKKVMVAVGFAITFAIILFILSCLRYCMDKVWVKVSVLTFGFMQFICLACAIGIWNNQCNAKIPIPDDFVLGSSVGMACVSVAFALNFVNFMFQSFIPTRDTSLPPAGSEIGTPIAAAGAAPGTVIQPTAVVYGQPAYGQPTYAPQAFAQPGVVQGQAVYATPVGASTNKV